MRALLVVSLLPFCQEQGRNGMDTIYKMTQKQNINLRFDLRTQMGQLYHNFKKFCLKIIYRAMVWSMI